MNPLELPPNHEVNIDLPEYLTVLEEENTRLIRELRIVRAGVRQRNEEIVRLRKLLVENTELSQDLIGKLDSPNGHVNAVPNDGGRS